MTFDYLTLSIKGSGEDLNLRSSNFNSSDLNTVCALARLSLDKLSETKLGSLAGLDGMLINTAFTSDQNPWL